MKVKDFIVKLQELDQNKNIWVIYDGCSAWEPKVTHLVNNYSEYAEMVSEEGVKIGDYALIAGGC